MGIGTSFGTVPVIAAIYVPLALKLGFGPAAIVSMISIAAALGDAGSPASDTTLGPSPCILGCPCLFLSCILIHSLLFFHCSISRCNSNRLSSCFLECLSA